VIWVWSTLLAVHREQARQRRMARALQEMKGLQEKLAGPRPRWRARAPLAQRVEAMLAHLHVERYLLVRIVEDQEHIYRQEHRGRPSRHTRYRRVSRPRLHLRWETDDAAIAFDRLTDGMYPLLTNDRTLTPREVLEAHKRQPTIEKRFHQTKTVHEIAPVLLKNEGRIEALFLLYFLALLVQALIERELRRAMSREGIQELPLYPEERCSRRPTAEQVLRLFSLVQRHALVAGDLIVKIFEPELTDLQRQVLRLLSVPEHMYRVSR
jgi:transposase